MARGVPGNCPETNTLHQPSENTSSFLIFFFFCHHLSVSSAHLCIICLSVYLLLYYCKSTHIRSIIHGTLLVSHIIRFISICEALRLPCMCSRFGSFPSHPYHAISAPDITLRGIHMHACLLCLFSGLQ